MADNALTVVIADGTTVGLRSEDDGTGKQLQLAKIGPLVPTLVAGHQYNQACASVFTMAVPTGAKTALVSVEGGNCRMREDGVNPTSTDGQLLTDGFVGELVLPNPLRFLQITGTVKLQITYRKYV